MTMTADRQAFLAAIAARPDDVAPRLIYADWLDENDEPEAAASYRAAGELPTLADFVRQTLADNKSILGQRDHDHMIEWAADRCYIRGTTYTVSDGGSTIDLDDADSMESAREIGEDLAAEWAGDLSCPEGGEIELTIIARDWFGDIVDRDYVVFAIDPDHEQLIGEATRKCDRDYCGDSPDDHDWTSGEGGLRENPGVWSLGGTKMLFASHCRTCGLGRREYHCGSQRNPGEHDRTTYSMPDRWCADCQSSDCDCSQSDEE